MKTAIITFTDPLHLDHSGVSYEITFGTATDGKDGIDGKSAYQSAQDGGFTGTETEFNQQLASIGDINTVLDEINGELNGLAEQLNGKYPAADGNALSEMQQQTAQSFTEHKQDSDRQFSTLRNTLNELVAGGSAQASAVVSGKEHVVGTFRDEEDNLHDIYENAFILSDLPGAAAQVAEYELSQEPLGFGRYIRVVDLEAVSTDGRTFYFGNYAVDKVYVADQITRAVIRCVSAPDGYDQLVLRMRYIKYMGDRLKFSVTVPAGTDTSAITLTVPPLKYDKFFAFTYTADDSVVGAYCRIWRRINRKWIDDTEFHHLGVPRTTGYTPDEALVMTDGCGNDRRFGFSCAIWANWGNDYSPNGFIAESSTSVNNPYITWEELRLMVDFGVSVCYHNVDERIYDKTVSGDVATGFVDDDARAFDKVGRHMKVLCLPDGNQVYLTAARGSGMVVFTRSSATSNQVYLKNCGPLRKVEVRGGNGSSEVTTKLADIAAQRLVDNPYWSAMTSHRVSVETMEMMATLYNLYGKAGDDSLWVASWDEIYEYVAMREGLEVKKSVDGQKVTFEVYAPTSRAFYFRELSFLLGGITTADGLTVTPESDTIKGLTYATHQSRWTGDDCVLMNVNFNANAVELAEKYTTRYEASADAADKEDALYFTSLLLPSLAAPFITRIDNVTPGEPGGLRLISASINTGAASTTNRATTITLEVIGNPTHYRVSESDSFEGAEWISYSAPYIPYMLSSEPGEKTVYVQLKDGTTQTVVVSDKINLAVQIVLNSISINGGAASTATREVTVAFNANLTPTYYRIGEVADLSALSWVAYTGNVNYTLSQNNGQKTVYAQIKNADGQSETKFAIIALSQTVSDKMRAILSLGWDWSAGGSSGMTIYDAATQIGKVRLSSTNATYNVYDTNGNIVGTAAISGLKQTGASNLGNTTGSNSGVYPDDVIKFSAYKPTETNEALVSITLNNPGTYKFKIFVNTKSASIDISAAAYTLENGVSVQNYAVGSYNILDNFHNVLELSTTVTAGVPINIRLTPGSSSSQVLLLNTIEIESI